MDEYKWVLGYLKQYKIRLAAGFLMVAAVSVMNTVVPKAAGIIVDRVIKGGENSLLTFLIAVIIGVTLIKTVVRYMYHVLFQRVSQNMVYSIRKDLYHKIQKLDFYYFDRTRTGDIMARMTGDIEAIRHFVAWVLYNIFESLSMLVFGLVVLSMTNLPLTLIMVSITPVLGWLAYRMGNSVKPVFSEIREQFARLNSVVKENISGNRVVKAFAKEEYETEKFTKENESFRSKNLKAAGIWAKYLPALESLASLLSVFLILAGGIFVINGSMTLGELVTFSGLTWALNMPMRIAGWLINDIQNFNASAEKIRGMLDIEPRVENSDRPVRKERLKGKVEFRNVNFSYGNEPVLHDVSFKVEPGEKVALLGPTGCGKTSIINLICRYYEADSGEVLVDGINVKDIDIRVLRRDISISMQDVFLFSNTVEGNIAYGVPEVSQDRVRQFAYLADADEFISSMPEGYSTIVGERGVGLSGGQKQRISLARALITDPSIIILDDTTSSVDLQTENRIHKSLSSYYEGKTAFNIAHRISTLSSADRIYVIIGGRIVESGSHRELLDKKGYYYRTYINQIGEAGA